MRALELMLLTFLVSSLIIFIILNHDPHAVAVAVLGQYYTQQDVQTTIHQLGLDRSAPVRYVDWITHFVRGDWGQSYTMNVPVAGLVFQRLRNSAVLGGLAFVVVVPCSVVMGLLAGVREDSLLDRVVSIVGLSAISEDRKSTRLNSSHTVISYAVFCLKKKTKNMCRCDHRDLDT